MSTTSNGRNWHAKQYSRFERERTRPVRDLLNAADATRVAHAVDLGCGPGDSTETLLDYAPQANVIGVDNSRDMLDAARKRLPQVCFECADIAAWDAPGPFDLILANASMQWVADHDVLFPKLVDKLAPGGRLAIQMPDNLDEPAHTRMPKPSTTVRGARACRACSARRAIGPKPITRCSGHIARRSTSGAGVSPSARRRHRRGHRMVQGQRIATLSRETRCARAARVSRSLSRRTARVVHGARRRRRAAAVSACVHRRDALTAQSQSRFNARGCVRAASARTGAPRATARRPCA